MDELNAQQRSAAEFQSGVAICIAVPGSGKTLTMTHRVGNLVKSGVAPEHILGLTFTRNAAQAMRERLVTILDEKATRVTLSTMHSFCYFLLKTEGKTFDILDGKELIIFMRKIMQKQKVKDISVGLILNEIKLAKNNLIEVDEFFELYQGDKSMTVIGEIYKEYDESKSVKMLMDFEDLLLETYRLFKEDSEILEKYRSTFKHLMIDEFQDTNPVQLEIIKLLVDNSEAGSSLWACGDDWQSIYSFTGASIGNILNFKDLFPDSTEYILSQNYRSTPEILTACQNLISHNVRKIEKVLKTDNYSGDEVTVLESATEEEEALLIASEIISLVECNSVPFTDFAVLYRANFQSRILEEVFSQQNLPYSIQNGLNFYCRKEVKNLLDYLTLISSPDTDQGDEALRNILNIPNRYLSRKFLGEIEQYAGEHGVSLYRALKTMPIEVPFTRHNVKDFVRFIDPLIGEIDDFGPAELIQEIRNYWSYDRYIVDDDIPSPDDQKIANLNQLVLSAARYDKVIDFLKYTETFIDQSSVNNKDGVKLMTIHKSKGLEFPFVFVVGMVESILPSKRGNLEEERRVCFVALSRAMSRLYMSYSHTHLGQPAKKSIFIDEALGKTPIK